MWIVDGNGKERKSEGSGHCHGGESHRQTSNRGENEKIQLKFAALLLSTTQHSHLTPPDVQQRVHLRCFGLIHHRKCCKLIGELWWRWWRLPWDEFVLPRRIWVSLYLKQLRIDFFSLELICRENTLFHLILYHITMTCSSFIRLIFRFKVFIDLFMRIITIFMCPLVNEEHETRRT